MAELSFAKSFLSALETKPIKLRSDHVFDPHSFQIRQPITLPKLSDSHPPMPKKVKTTNAPGSSKSITVHLKSARNPVLDITLGQVPLATATTQQLKEAVQARIKPSSSEGKIPLDKIKILWKRKPAQGKTVTEILADEPELLAGGGHAEFGVMILGGAVAFPEEEAQESTGSDAAQTAEEKAGGSESTAGAKAHNVAGDAVMLDASFWDDLEGFLQTKINDPEHAARVKALFRGAWESRR